MTPQVLLDQSACVCAGCPVFVQVFLLLSLSKKDLYIHAASLYNRDLVAWCQLEGRSLLSCNISACCRSKCPTQLAELESLWNFELCNFSL